MNIFYFRLTKLQRKIYVASCTLRYFTFREWNFSNTNLFDLEERLLEADRADWAYDFRDRDVIDYFEKCIMGSRRYLLNEPDSTLPQARKHFRRYVLYWLKTYTGRVFNTLFLLLKLIFYCFSECYGWTE